MKPKGLLFSGGFFLEKDKKKGRITRRQGASISIRYHLYHVKMIEKTLMVMGTPTLECGLVIWFHKLMWCMLIPISRYPPTTCGVYLPEELWLWLFISTDSLGNSLLFSETHRSTVQKGKFKHLIRGHIRHSLQLFPCWCWAVKHHSEVTSRCWVKENLGVLLQALKGQKCLFSRLRAAISCIQESIVLFCLYLL